MSSPKSLKLPRSDDVRELEGWRRSLTDTSEKKADKVIGAADGDLAGLDSTGNLTDSGIAADNVQLRAIPSQTVNTDYQVLYEDQTIWADATAGDVTLTLVDAGKAKWREWIIEKIDSSSNKVIIAGAGADTINGSATFELLAQYESVRPQSTGTEYLI